MSQTANHRSEDIGQQQIAAVYAKAFLQVAEEAGQTLDLLEAFESLIIDVLDPNPRFESVLTSMLVSPDEKIALLEQVFGRSAPRALLNFLKVIAQHGRLDFLRSIWRGLSHQYKELRGLMEVELRTARPVAAPLLAEITERLQEVFAREPVISQVEDRDLIAGLVVRIGDTVYDGSVATRLRQAKQAMIQKSVELIETQRERLLSV